MGLRSSRTLEAASDTELISRALARDELAVRALIKRYNRRLYRVARSIVADDSEAEDVLQEAYFRAFAALGSYRAESTLATWLTRIVLNEAFQRVRRRTDVPLSAIGRHSGHESIADIIPFPTLAHSPIDPERVMAQSELFRIVEKAIDALPHEFRAVLVARIVEGMSVEETEAAFDLLPGTYEVVISGKRVTGVTVRSGNDTRIRVGVLRVSASASTRIDLVEGADERSLASDYGPSAFGLPIGEVGVRIAGQTEVVTIEAGQVTEF